MIFRISVFPTPFSTTKILLESALIQMGLSDFYKVTPAIMKAGITRV